ncbi:TonB-dependent receptor domain-containing protein [Cognatilysobacter terrigena]|uniref:TonB-dependent receptor domain-containing protein n=1 Tax=Cognatilysobacter terrigena TaxID=2488749 RepID=UPI00105FB409|nr:TonB-dependent receptor [Lysobacter terrigena]
MYLKRSKLRDAIGIALGATAAFTAASAVAQTAPADANATPQTLDRVQVTGSRIRQVDVETAQPVLMISRKDIEQQGFQSVGDILQNISAVGTPPISRAAPLSSGENVGGTYISLRNLGAQRTLVLVNGKRLGITTSGLSDVSQIPAVAIERIEVLKDGASSIYGSDAIAGVINIITRTNYEGAAGSIYYGQYDQGDGAITKGDMIMGFGNERGSLTVGAEWGKEEGVNATDRDFSAYPRGNWHPTDQWTTVGQYGGFVTTATTPVPGVPTGTRVILRPGGDPRNRNDYVAQNTSVGTCNGATASTGCTPGSTKDKSNTLEQTDLRTPLETKAVYLDGVLNITDNVRFRGNLLWGDRESSRHIAGYPMQAASFNTPMSAQSYWNPEGATISNWWRRGWEVPRVTTADSTNYRLTAGLEGSFDIGDHLFDWDVGYVNVVNKQTQDTYGNFNLANVRNAVGPSFLQNGQVVCGTPGNVIAGCVTWNPFVPYGVVGNGGLTGNTALQNYLFQNEHATGRTETTVMSANLSGTIFTLPAGDLGFAVGYEHRKEDGKYVPDALAVTGGSTNLSSGPTRGGYDLDEVYLELQVPILADVAFAKELTLNIASRYSDYNTFGDTVNNKFGLKWRPIDQLLLRATYADGFRAPTIADLYGGGSQTFDSFTDPCDTNFGDSRSNPTTRANCKNGVGGQNAMGAIADTYRQLGQGLVPVGSPNSQTPVAFNRGSNPTLTPELSKSQTIGGVWSPPFLSGFNMSVDWWKIRIADTIVTDSPSQILADCYVSGIASRCSPQLFTRDPALGYINFMSYGNRNAGFRKVEGYDVDFSYRLATDAWGTFNANLNSTYTAKDYFVSTNDPTYPTSGVGFTSTFRIRANFNLGWQKGPWGATWTSRYYSSMKEGCTYVVPGSTTPNLECEEITYAPTGAYVGTTTTPASSISRRHVVGANTFHDVQLRWEAPWKATVAVGANNVFNHIGPVMYTQPSANVSYYGGFDIGRFWYMRYTQRF